MYHWLYNLSVKLYTSAIHLASIKNPKARSWVKGRRHLFLRLRESIQPADQVLWFHAASLGEAEMIIPVIQACKKEYSEMKIMLTFFSPSGYENFKHYDLADWVFYLPADTPANARKFISILKPRIAFFVKYEIWANYFLELRKNKIPSIIAPAVFRENQFYFKPPHSGFFIPLLQSVNAIMVQDINSKRILESRGVQGVKLVGDSRFDRVLKISNSEFSDPLLEDFCKDSFVIIGGSTWPAGEEILRKLIDQNTQVKLIIAPHNIQEKNIGRVHKLMGVERSFRYSEKPPNPGSYRVCIIDNVGLLSRLYRYGHFAYIGGAFGKGIHNSLEAVAHGLPVVFGPNHRNFIEPGEMISQGFAWEIRRAEDMQEKLKMLLEDRGKHQLLAQKARQYVRSGSGVSEKIMKELRLLLSSHDTTF